METVRVQDTSNVSVTPLKQHNSKHGTFRPALLGLVQNNTSQAIEDTTRKAYKALFDEKAAHANALPALKILVGLRGIGPATASLLLSVLEPTEVPFFSDELFRWCAWDDEGKTGKGWQRKIKYNVKEYETVVQSVEKLRERLRRGLGEGDEGVRAVDVERVAWVLGKEGRDVGVLDGEEEDVKTHGVEVSEKVEGEEKEAVVDEDVTVEKQEKRKPAVKKGTKRKATDSKPPAEGTRKSTRTKKT